METGIPENANGNGSATPNKTPYNPNLNLMPVRPEESGEGLPYAPENWPLPGDVWGWRTGRRVANNGHFLDRYLYLPIRLCRIENAGSSRKKHGFASKLSVERYIRGHFPDVDMNAFFALFSWKIPACQSALMNRNLSPLPIAAVPLQQIAALSEQSPSDLNSDIVGCKVGNKKCSSLILEEVEKYLPVMPCEICCLEPSFCRDCTCILCCKIVDSAYGGYSYIKCPAKVGNDNNICGHVAHMKCALRVRLAGTVGGSIGLDAEYFCRRCDRRTELMSYVNKLMETCEAINCRADIEEILNLGACILRGSQKPTAKELLHRIELAISKLQCGTHLDDIWKEDDDLTACSAGFSEDADTAMEDIVNGSPSDVITGTESYGSVSESTKLELEVYHVLQALRNSQKLEYNMAEERLHQHKNYLQNLFRQLESEKSELASAGSSCSEVLLHTVREREEQIRREVKKFRHMKKVADGFGRTPKAILKRDFGLEIADDSD